MSFKNNIILKMKTDRLSENVRQSLTSAYDRPAKIDRKSMEEMLSLSGYKHSRERFMDLYIKKKDGQEWILVLDNELPVYNTTVDDVLLRKNPTLKEMISIRNAIKILRDTDVIVSKKNKTVDIIQKELIEPLNLSYTEQDLSSIMDDGISALEKWNKEEVIICMDIFCELLRYVILPKPFQMDNYIFKGVITEKTEKTYIGPVLIYDAVHNLLNFLEESFESKDKESIAAALDVAVGRKKPDIEGKDVFRALKNKITQTKS
ncbi:MAG: hypothetical protein KJ737_19185 [Proteobacteria bacterium]|nr:hypothetical protein [Pseudomonadota bacterium]